MESPYSQKTLVIATGGTIDAKPYPDPLHPPANATMEPVSVIPQALEELKHAQKIAPEYEVHLWERKDSQQFTHEDLRSLANYIITRYQQGMRYIVITHGTSAMCHNAAQLMEMIAQAGCQELRLLFTGAMVPYRNGSVPGADALINLAYALNICRNTHIQPGVYIAMQEQLFDPRTTRKNEQTRRFEPR